MPGSITLAGGAKFIAKTKVWLEALEKAQQRVVYGEAQKIMLEAKRQTPVDKGTLRASGTVMPPHRVFGGKWEVILGFGGAASAYAVVQHENLGYHHTTGKAKYLEDPVKAAVRGFEMRTFSEMKRQGL